MRAAAWMQLRPIPPHPTTATVAPAGTRAVRITAPTPVGTAHPTTAARSMGMCDPTLTSEFSCTNAASAKVPRLVNWKTPRPSGRLRRCLSSGARCSPPCWHSVRRPESTTCSSRNGLREGDDVVARLDVGDVTADLSHHALVPENGRHGDVELTVDEVQVAVAEPSRGHLDHDLARPGRVEHDFLDHELPGVLIQHRGSHGCTSSVVGLVLPVQDDMPPATAASGAPIPGGNAFSLESSPRVTPVNDVRHTHPRESRPPAAPRDVARTARGPSPAWAPASLWAPRTTARTAGDGACDIALRTPARSGRV